jgi:putative redox protein
MPGEDGMEVNIQRIKGLAFAAKGNTNHWLVMDTEEKHGGEYAASKPMELILMSLGGCTGMDVVSILNKMKVHLNDFSIDVSAEQAEDFPKVFTKIHIAYRFFGKQIDEEKVKRAIELSRTKYCSVSAMLSQSVQINYSYQIISE